MLTQWYSYISRKTLDQNWYLIIWKVIYSQNMWTVCKTNSKLFCHLGNAKYFQRWIAFVYIVIVVVWMPLDLFWNTAIGLVCAKYFIFCTIHLISICYLITVSFQIAFIFGKPDYLCGSCKGNKILVHVWWNCLNFFGVQLNQFG